ncbi:hypothetical protein YDYSY3_01570 [Paenibacillus chitinolyticus]|nr:hypothetical protein YDYSY3_01570 [Paenibacillus chitinolyticus]
MIFLIKMPDVDCSKYVSIWRKEIPVDNILAELGHLTGWKTEGIHTLRNI